MNNDASTGTTEIREKGCKRPPRTLPRAIAHHAEWGSRNPPTFEDAIT